MNHESRRGPRALAATLAFGLLLAACGGEDTTATTAAPATTTTEAENVVEVGMHDFAFVGLPASVPAGTRLTVSNHAEAELHEVVVFKLADGDERKAADLVTLPPHELEAALGAPVAVLLAAPGGDQIPAVGDGTLSEPGNYVLFCFIPTGVDPQVYLEAAAQSEGGPPQIEGAGPPHFVHGMFADLVVE
jgi:hypothetical protein